MPCFLHDSISVISRLSEEKCKHAHDRFLKRSSRVSILILRLGSAALPSLRKRIVFILDESQTIVVSGMLVSPLVSQQEHHIIYILLWKLQGVRKQKSLAAEAPRRKALLQQGCSSITNHDYGQGKSQDMNLTNLNPHTLAL